MASNIKVDIVKPTATNGSLSLKGDSGGSATANGITVDSSGNTSITGTTTISSADINGGTIDGTTIATSDITVGSGKTLNVSAGTLTLAANQISGDSIDGGTISNFASTGIDDNLTSGGPAVTIDSSGNVGIGTSITTDAGVTITPDVNRDGGWNAKLALQSTGSGNYPALVFSGCSGTTRYGSIVQTASISGIDITQITSEIRLPNPSATEGTIFFLTNSNVGTSAPSSRMEIGSSGNVKINNLSASSDVQTDASKNLITTSDARLKNDLGVITDSAINVVQQIIPKYFSWKNDENNSRQLGFFAQDIYPVLPEAAPRALKYIEVGKDENDEPILEQVLDEEGNPDYEWGFTDRPIIAMCVKAIQEQQALIESQQSQIDALTARIEALENAAG